MNPGTNMASAFIQIYFLSLLYLSRALQMLCNL